MNVNAKATSIVLEKDLSNQTWLQHPCCPVFTLYVTSPTAHSFERRKLSRPPSVGWIRPRYSLLYEAEQSSEQHRQHQNHRFINLKDLCSLTEEPVGLLSPGRISTYTRALILQSLLESLTVRNVHILNWIFIYFRLNFPQEDKTMPANQNGGHGTIWNECDAKKNERIEVVGPSQAKMPEVFSKNLVFNIAFNRPFRLTTNVANLSWWLHLGNMLNWPL